MLIQTGRFHRPFVGCIFSVTTIMSLAGTALAQSPSEGAVLSPPFGALSLFVLGGTLFAGIVSGVGLASLRTRTSAVGAAMSESDPKPEIAAPQRSTEIEKSEPLPPIVAELDGGGEKDAAFWIEDLAHGPNFGPRIVGVVVAPDCDGDDALARLAAVARDTDRDLAIVDACYGAERLADALDQRLDRPMRPLSAPGAKVEIIRLAEVLAERDHCNATAAKDALLSLGARVDVVLVDLPQIEDWSKIPALIGALDDVAVLRTEETNGREIRLLCQAARQAGAPITGQVLVLDEAA